MQNKLVDTLRLADIAELFRDSLNDCYPEIEIGSLRYAAGDALEKLDPIAFNCGAYDYADSLLTDGILIEIDGELYHA